MNEDEIWKTHPVLGIEVSNLGRVITCRGKHITFGSDKGDGYKQIGYKGKLYSVHRLVAETFLKNPHNYPFVNHKDENPSNNCLNNLEWCTNQYNINYGTTQQRRVANTDWKAKVAHTDYKAIAEKQSKTVYQYTKEGVLVGVWTSVAECGRNGYCQSKVSACCRGERKTHRGFIWSYEEKG